MLNERTNEQTKKKNIAMEHSLLILVSFSLRRTLHYFVYFTISFHIIIFSMHADDNDDGSILVRLNPNQN